MIRRDPRVSSLPIEFGFTPPVPLEHGSSRIVTFAYRTPLLPGKGFVLLAPEYRIEADYLRKVVLEVSRVKPSDMKLDADELGPIQNIHMPFEEIEKMDRDFDSGYKQILRAFIEGHAVDLDPQQRLRMREVLPIIVDPRFRPMLSHESPEFVRLLEDLW